MNMCEKVVITQERFAELIKKEFVFDYKKAEIEQSKYATECEKRLFGIEKESEDCE